MRYNTLRTRTLSWLLSVLFLSQVITACATNPDEQPASSAAPAKIAQHVASAAATPAASPAPVINAPTEFTCRFAHHPITIDGVADEADWKSAPVIDTFWQPWVKPSSSDKPWGAKAKSPTKARLLWDRDHLYFFAEMQDADLFADVTRHDGQLWDNDVFELFFKPADDKPGYYEFQVNAANATLDVLIPRRGAGGFPRFKNDGEFEFTTAVKLDGTLNKWTDTDKGWVVEGRFRWRDFVRTGGRPNVGEKWKFALCRYDYSVEFEGPDLSTCAPLKSLPYPNFHYFEDYATLVFEGPKNAEAQALWQGPTKFVGTPEPPKPYRAVRAYPKLTVNYPITAERIPGSDQLLLIDQKWSYGPARIARMKDSPDADALEQVIDIAGVGYCLTFHPKFAENGYVYLGHNARFEAAAGGNGEARSRITRYTMKTSAPWTLDPKSATTIIEWPSDGHNGAAVAFGKDGMMYVTSGDGTSDSDTNLMGQRMDTLLAKLLRIDVDNAEQGKTYSVPKDNPFVSMNDARPETWAYGFRNPWRLECDRETGQIWVVQNGQDLWEQGYLVERGANYGWSVFEGSHPFYPTRQLGPTPHVKPTVEHHHSEARSLTGGIVYRGDKLPALRGAFIYGDYSTGKIWAVRHDGKAVAFHQEIADTALAITDFVQNAAGELLVLDHQGNGKGGFHRLEALSAQELAAPSSFPRKLSESGLFASVKNHTMAPGVIPYSVNAPQWADGAVKERYLVVPQKPGEDRRIDLSQTRGWNFPNETLVLETLSLDTESGNAKSRRHVETRVLLKQENEWAGYSYRWNDEQTDATLVEAKGGEREIEIKEGGATRKQLWKFPSRTECLVCHSRAANFVLGLQTAQFNREHEAGGENQLVTLERLGLLRTNPHSELHQIIREEGEKKGLNGKPLDDFVGERTATRMQRGGSPSTMLGRSPARYPKLADPYDAKADLDARARSYLHVNCSVCHVEAGGGNAKMELEFTALREKMNVFDAAPQHHKFDLAEAKIIAPGDPQKSVLWWRVNRRGPQQMPPLVSTQVDTQAVQMLTEWIKGMK